MTFSEDGSAVVVQIRKYKDDTLRLQVVSTAYIILLHVSTFFAKERILELK